MKTLQEDATVDVECTVLSSKSIEEYRTKRGKLIIKQGGNDWKSCIWINIYIEINDEWILMYLDNSCIVNEVIGFLRTSQKLEAAVELFDDDNIKVYKADYDGKLPVNEEDALLNRNEVIGELGVVNVYIRSKCMRIEDIDDELPMSNYPSFVIETSSTPRSIHGINGNSDSSIPITGSCDSLSNGVIIDGKKIQNGCGCLVM